MDISACATFRYSSFMSIQPELQRSGALCCRRGQAGWGRAPRPRELRVALVEYSRVAAFSVGTSEPWSPGFAPDHHAPTEHQGAGCRLALGAQVALAHIACTAVTCLVTIRAQWQWSRSWSSSHSRSMHTSSAGWLNTVFHSKVFSKIRPPRASCCLLTSASSPCLKSFCHSLHLRAGTQHAPRVAIQATCAVPARCHRDHLKYHLGAVLHAARTLMSRSLEMPHTFSAVCPSSRLSRRMIRRGCTEDHTTFEFGALLRGRRHDSAHRQKLRMQPDFVLVPLEAAVFRAS